MSVIQENNQSILNHGENVIYGYFLRSLWRNEKSGISYFQIVTRQKMPLKQQYRKKEVLRDKNTKEDITWYTISCNAATVSVPAYSEKTPVRITGYFLSEHDTGYGWDFKITSIKEASVEETVTIKYLASETFPEITYEQAVLFVQKFGADVFQVIEQKDMSIKIQKETGMSAYAVKELTRNVLNTKEERKIFDFLGPLNIPYPYAAKAVESYSTKALHKIKQNPHFYGGKLGLSFRQCDAIAKACGLDAEYNGRLISAAYETMRVIGQQGHVWVNQEQFYSTMQRVVMTDSYQKDISLVNFLSTTNHIIGTINIDKKECFYNKELFEAESRIARNILRLTTAPKDSEIWDWSLLSFAEEACKIKYGPQQINAFPTVLNRKGIKVIVGGPGTGKTTTIKGVLIAYKLLHPDHIIKLCAPTGRAAQRLAESTDMEASTVHRLLDYRPYGDTTTHRDANNPIEADVIVIDEMSMMNIELFDIFLNAVKTGTTLIFMGDTNQLESVGAGSILRDLLQMSEKVIDKCALTDVFRQKGGSPIIENSIRIQNNFTDLMTCEDFQICNVKNAEECLDVVSKLMSELYNPDDPFETQILCPARKGLSGIDSLNTVLQKQLNPGKKGLQYGSVLYRANDKIIMNRNNYDLENCYYNGDVGIIKEVLPGELKVDIRNEIHTIKRQHLDEMRLSYGMTIHKSQGSEFKNVIIVLPMDPKNMLVRNLFYTAVTRAKKRVYIVNEGSAMQTSIKTDNSEKRQTTLLMQFNQKIKQN